MAVHSPLNAFSFDVSLIEIGQEIKLLEHFKKQLDHPVYLTISSIVNCICIYHLLKYVCDIRMTFPHPKML
jgi:hypothetical protein